MAWRRAGQRTALLTLISTTGASPRPVGSQIAVSESGESCGMITGGCAEGTLVLDAIDAIRLGENRIELYGEGSRYKDITLPCGSGLKVWFDVRTGDDELAAIIARHQARQPASLAIAPPAEPVFTRTYLPTCRLVVVGQGPIVTALAQLAPTLEVQLDIWSPDSVLLARLGGRHLTGPDDFTSTFDPYSALALIFHDHSYEPQILFNALASPAFFIGALGSRRAHARRLDTLAEMGADAEALARINGPIGLDIGAASPPEIALAILAQVVERWRKTVTA